MTFERVDTDEADKPCMAVSATATWVVKVPDYVVNERYDLEERVREMESEVADKLIREMRFDIDDGIGDYDVDVSAQLIRNDGGDADDD